MYVFLYSLNMETISLSDVRKKLSSLLKQVETTHERVTVTRNGRPAAVLISPEDLEALEETVSVLSDPEAMKRLREGEDAVAAGDVLDESELRKLVDRQGG
jgi:prevent-host-death family protein